MDEAGDDDQPGDGDEDVEEGAEDSGVEGEGAGDTLVRSAPGEGDEEDDADEGLGPEVAEVFAEDVERLGQHE